MSLLSCPSLRKLAEYHMHAAPTSLRIGSFRYDKVVGGQKTGKILLKYDKRIFDVYKSVEDGAEHSRVKSVIPKYIFLVVVGFFCVLLGFRLFLGMFKQKIVAGTKPVVVASKPVVTAPVPMAKTVTIGSDKGPAVVSYPSVPLSLVAPAVPVEVPLIVDPKSYSDVQDKCDLTLTVNSDGKREVFICGDFKVAALDGKVVEDLGALRSLCRA